MIKPPLVLDGELFALVDGSHMIAGQALDGAIYEWASGYRERVRITVEDLSDLDGDEGNQ